MKPFLTQFKELNHDDIPDFIDNAPFVADWVQYRDEDMFAMLNYDESIKRNRITYDIAYCATEALHGFFQKTVSLDRRHFKPSKLSEHQWE